MNEKQETEFVAVGDLSLTMGNHPVGTTLSIQNKGLKPITIYPPNGEVVKLRWSRWFKYRFGKQDEDSIAE
jgi:hypothetical protein